MMDNEPEPVLHPNDHRMSDSVGVRVLCSAVSVALFGVWFWLSRAFSSLSLDYPLRRAGENADYPALGTTEFYIGCLSALAEDVLFSMWLWAIPMALALGLAFRGFRITIWRWRLVLAVSVITLPSLLCGAYEIYRYMSSDGPPAVRGTP